jgi:hypothetical protein
VTLLVDATALFIEQRRRFSRLLPRRPGEHPAHFERAVARLEAADAAVTLAKAAPSRELANEAHRASCMARWAVDDIARERFGEEREEYVLQMSTGDGTRILPIAAE